MNKLPLITSKQQEILLLIYKYRFLNRIQIQTFLNHKAHKRINDWLKDLHTKECVGRIYSTNFGENTKPAIYYMGINGIRWLKTQDECAPEVIQKLYREKNRQESFIQKSMLIADMCLELLKHSNQTENLSYELLTETNLADPESPFHFLTEYDIQLFIVKRKNKKRTHLLITTFESTLPRYRMRKRIRTWLNDFYDGYDWDTETFGPFPTIFVLCPTKALMIYCKRLATRLLEEKDSREDDLHMCLTYESLAREKGMTSGIWEEAIPKHD